MSESDPPASPASPPPAPAAPPAPAVPPADKGPLAKGPANAVTVAPRKPDPDSKDRWHELETRIQALTNFLHWTFPGHPVPGTADIPGSPDSLKES